jgi:hypothetical protein
MRNRTRAPVTCLPNYILFFSGSIFDSLTFFPLSLFCSFLGFQEWQDWLINIFMTRDWNYPKAIARQQEWLPPKWGQLPTWWVWTRHLMRNTWLPSSDDSGNNVSRTPGRTRIEMMINHTTGLTKITRSVSYPLFYKISKFLSAPGGQIWVTDSLYLFFLTWPGWLNLLPLLFTTAPQFDWHIGTDGQAYSVGTPRAGPFALKLQ